VSPPVLLEYEHRGALYAWRIVPTSSLLYLLLRIQEVVLHLSEQYRLPKGITQRAKTKSYQTVHPSWINRYCDSVPRILRRMRSCTLRALFQRDKAPIETNEETPENLSRFLQHTGFFLSFKGVGRERRLHCTARS
jgi:hypothetical protein